MNALLKILAVIGGLAVLALILFLVVGLVLMGTTGRVPAETILEVNLDQCLVEYVPDDPVAMVLIGDKPRVRHVVEALDLAARDDRVVGLVARIGSTCAGLGTIQELRDAVLAFRAQDKPAIAYSETLGELRHGTGAYYLATAFDEIYLQPAGDVMLTGLIYELAFRRGTLDKLDIVPRMDQRYEYKNAMNIYTDTEFNEPFEESLESLMHSQFDGIVRDIAGAREMDPDRVRALVDRGPFTAVEAETARLVNGLAYRDEVYARLRERVGEDAELLYLSAYRERTGGRRGKGETIALIYGVGAILSGESRYDLFNDRMVMGSDTVAAAFRQAVDDDSVRAILFRVDSPGGSYVASDVVWREIERAKQADKPVIVSMGSQAASGGYYVAMGADKIVAQPGTITGSIGVYGGKLVTTGLWEKLGVSFDEVHTSDHGTFLSTTHDYSRGEWERLQSLLDRIYEDFTGKVAQGRTNLTPEEVEQVARGRIWTGEQALSMGLVDELGGFAVALRLAREEAGLDPDAPVQLREFPRPKNLWQTFRSRRPASSAQEGAAVDMARRTMESVRPLARLASQVGLGPLPGELTMPVAAPVW